MNTNDVIEHHGVKGMKWGQRAAKKISSGMDHHYAKASKAYNDYINK